MHIPKLSLVILINPFAFWIIFIFSNGSCIRPINIIFHFAIDFRYSSSGPLHIISNGCCNSLKR